MATPPCSPMSSARRGPFATSGAWRVDLGLRGPEESPVWNSAGGERSGAVWAPEVRRARERSSEETRESEVALSETNVTTTSAEDPRLGKETTMSRWIGLTIAAGAIAAMTLGCSQQGSGTAVVIEDKVYTVTPASVNVKAGIVTGEVTELKNTSANQTVRLVTGKIQYIDFQGQPIKLEESRTDSTIKFATYGSERLDPGQDATQSLDVDFPAEALKAKKLKEIRLELAYIPSPFQEETVNFTVSIGAGK